MEVKTVKTGSIMAWLLASRPKTLTCAAVPVMVGLSSACADIGVKAFNCTAALLCLLFAFIMQIDANFINDYFDFVRGNDDGTRLGPRRACAQGWILPVNMLKAIVITTLSACTIGLPLVVYGGLWLLLVGLLCVLFCFLYTTKLSYLGLGDILVLVFFGIVPVCMTYYLQAGTVTLCTLFSSIACGLVIDTLLIINNYRDIDGDQRSGKITLIVKIGSYKGRVAYFISGLSGVAVGLMLAFYGHWLAAILPSLYLVLHYFAYKKMVKINKGKALNTVLGLTARNIFIYGILVSVGFLFG